MKRRIVKVSKKRSGPVKPPSAFNPELVHRVTKEVYMLRLVAGSGDRAYEVPEKKIDRDCLFYEATVRACLQVCLDLGLLDKEKLSWGKDQTSKE